MKEKKVNSAKEIRRAIEDKVVTYGWWRICEDVEELLTKWESDIRKDQREKDNIRARKTMRKVLKAV
jgi:hypothetical protein